MLTSFFHRLTLAQVEYVILRGQRAVSGGNLSSISDVDVLVSRKCRSLIITDKAVKPGAIADGVKYFICDGPFTVPLDLRVQGDNYYPDELCQQLLESRTLINGVYCATGRADFLARLYHEWFHRARPREERIRSLESANPSSRYLELDVANEESVVGWFRRHYGLIAPTDELVDSRLRNHRQHVFCAERVANYERAEMIAPSARANEFRRLKEELSRIPRSNVLELGSGSGVLTRELAGRCSVTCLDASFSAPHCCASFYHTDLRLGIPLAVSKRRFAGVVSLAAMHHVAEVESELPSALVDGLSRVTRPGGMLLLQDVTDRSDTSRRFFSDIVERYSRPLHRGVFVDWRCVALQFVDHGWRTCDVSVVDCPWVFETERMATEYTQSLFNLDLDFESLQKRLRPWLRVGNTGVELSWDMDLLAMEKQ